jgi:NADH-quinone oxidoreductase subunit L
MSVFQERPGLLFVAATLLPLAAFTLLLIAGGLRNFLRAYKNNEIGGNLFNLLGGEVTGRGPAYVGLGAIVLAFFLSFSGFCWYLGEYSELQHQIHETNEKIEVLEAKVHSHKETEEEAKEFKALKGKQQDDEKNFNYRWSESVRWAAVRPARLSDSDLGVELKVGYRIDSLSATMFVMVTFVASLIFLFSIGYMKEELQLVVEDHEVHADDGGHYKRRGRFGRFFLFLSLFSFSMLNLLLADNLFQIFVSWELVGICSFLLIGFYLERQSASNAANKAFIANRVGDAGFIIGLLIIWTHIGSFNFEDINKRLRCGDPVVAHALSNQYDNRIVSGTYDKQGKKLLTAAPGEAGSHALIMPRTPPTGHIHYRKEKVDGDLTFVVPNVYQRPAAGQFGVMPYWMLVVAGLGIFLGCVGKSAQFPLQVWLPDAMEGPTPVSALIHAATMVAAGVYLVGRAYPLFTAEVLLTIAYMGAITMFVGASIAVVQTDIKKVLAYSTVSQLGVMMLGLGVGGWAAGLFHLITHACFKALLFLGSGSVIYGCHHEQNMLKMGGLYSKMKITALTMLMGVLAIAGFPLFAGWYSKDAVVAATLGFSMANHQHFLLLVLVLVTAGITTFYMFRMWFMTFTGKPRDKHVHEHAHETPWVMTTPLIALAVLSVCVAWGWPLWDASASELEKLLSLSRPASVEADFGPIHAHHHDAHDEKAPHIHAEELAAATANEFTHKYHSLAGYLALIMVLLGSSFSLATYYYHVLDPGESQDHFPGLHRFLWHKWYFDELYSAVVVRPGLAVSQWCAAFDRSVVDALVNLVGRSGVKTSVVSGQADRGIVDGFVNLLANVSFGIGTWLRNVQTGYLRSYILFLALAAMGLFVLFAAYVGAVATGSP